MSDRCTIFIALNQELIEWTYCRNRSLQDIVLLSLKYGALLDGCSSQEEVLTRLNRKKPMTQEEIKEVLTEFACCESTVIVDLDTRNLYFDIDRRWPYTPSYYERIRIPLSHSQMATAIRKHDYPSELARYSFPYKDISFDAVLRWDEKYA